MAITTKQFDEIQKRLTGTRRKPAGGELPPEPRKRASSAAVPEGGDRIILGVDPSLRGTGFGVIRIRDRQPAALGFGCIHCPATWDRSRCLAQILTTLQQVIREHHPTTCAIEGLFFAQNLQTALIMGEARGAALAAVAEAGLEVFEHAPRRVKQAIVGYGAAQKSAVAKMVQRMLRLEELPQADAADALALALAHAHESSTHALRPLKRV